ncbi:MAG: hypothetical protein A2901_02590 [Elusimicrobia bacterium RIFCSPLOWO2_01_FULL_54_10]|nr:MAG: hypothetical protein A2901_02590 [Elusimicrobia bacterium RIFCSPLOWO2_01_FULL_54_10]
MCAPSQNRFSNFLFALLLLSPACAWTAPPPPGFTAPDRAVCRINPVAAAQRTSALKAAPFFQVPLSPTTAYVLVIRVDFSDKIMTKTKTETESFMESLKQYYSENSYSLFTVSATVTQSTTSAGNTGAQGAYRLPQTLASYAQGLCTNYDQIAKDALSAANTDYNMAPFNHVMIYHAGIGAETANDSSCQTDNIWSVFAPTIPPTGLQTDGIRSPMTYNGRTFNGATFVPESEAQNISPLGVICHEYGHQLGLPDLYKTPSNSVVGKWSLMDAGIYIGSPLGSNPAHLDAWSKQFLGFFSSPQTVTASDSAQTLSLGYAAGTANAYVRIPISGVGGVNPNTEYFLIERRGRSSLTGKIYDDALPYGTLQDGYLIWHVDDSILSSEERLAANSVNSGSPNLGLDLVEAGGTGQAALTSGVESDSFPGSTGRNIFAAPFSNAFGGQQTGIAVTGFYGAALTVKKAFAGESQEITRVINFPNPGGPAYAQKQGAPAGTLTTIVLHASKPAQNILLTLHDMSGALVRDVPEFLIRANGSASGTQKFVYEFDWDGTTDDGGRAAAGVYLYRFRIDDNKSETGKLILIR